MALWNIYYILYLKFANKFCYSTHNLSKETVLRSGLNFKVEIRSGWERRFLIQVFFGRQPDSSLIQRHNSIQGQNGESGPKKLPPEPDPRKVKKSGSSLKDIEVLAARLEFIKRWTKVMWDMRFRISDIITLSNRNQRLLLHEGHHASNSCRSKLCLRNRKILRSFILDILGTLAHFSSFETVPLWWNFLGVGWIKRSESTFILVCCLDHLDFGN